MKEAKVRTSVKWRTLCAILCSVSVTGLIVVFVFPGIVQQGTLGSFRIGGINYDSRALRQRIYKKSEYLSSVYHQIELSFAMRARSNRGYQNLFQTAPANLGLRLELSKPNTLALIAGSNDKLGYTPFVLTSTLSLNRWHTFYLKADSQNHLLVRLDEAPVVDVTLPALSYTISDIAIGSGFNSSRPFDGEIRDASLSYEFYKGQEAPGLEVLIIKIALFVLALFFLLLLFLMRGFAKQKNSEAAA